MHLPLPDQRKKPKESSFTSRQFLDFFTQTYRNIYTKCSLFVITNKTRKNNRVYKSSQIVPNLSDSSNNADLLKSDNEQTKGVSVTFGRGG